MRRAHRPSEAPRWVLVLLAALVWGGSLSASVAG